MECKFCNNKMEKIGDKVQGYIEGTFFDVYQCDSCNLQQADIQEKFEKEYANIYERIYKNSSILPGYSRYYRYSKEILESKNPIEYITEVEDVYNSVYSCIKEYSEKLKEPKILELGSGLGYFTYGLKKSGYDITGLDISKDAVEKAIKAYGEHYICADLFKYSEKNQEKYDIVIMTEVIEHISEPDEFLKAIKKILKKGGIVIITTPNKGAYPKNFVWYTDFPPIHLWWFSKESLKKIGQVTGYKNVSFYNIFNLKNAEKVFYNPREEQRKSEYIFAKDGKINGNWIKNENSLKNKVRIKLKNKFFYSLIRKIYWKVTLKEKIESKEPNIICAIFQK